MKPIVLIISGKQGSGKCLKKGTLIKTPTGSKKIEDMSIGDEVYGYNHDKTISISKVKEIHNNGIKEVVDLNWSDKTLVSATLDHRFMSYSFRTGIEKEKSVSEFNTKDMILQTFIDIPGGDKDVPEAYAIGALLGDGCCTLNGLVMSNTDENIVKKVFSSINAESYRKSHKSNHHWRFYKPDPTKLIFYNRWCKGRKAHEKILDIEEVKTWNRKSQLELLAGLIDTDGSVRMRKKGLLSISIGMQAKSVIECIRALLLDLFQFETKIYIDNRPKYKNGPVYIIKIGQNKYTKKILKELPTVCKSKTWKSEYEDLVGRSNKNPNGVMFTVSEKYYAPTYDISIDNDTNLYLLANGFITHNSSLATNALAGANEAGIPSAHIKFADIIYEMHDEIGKVAAKYSIPFNKKESVLLQLLGTEWGRNTKGPDVWVEATKNKIKALAAEGKKFFVIDDCRFPNEANITIDGMVTILIRLEASEEVRKNRTDAWRDNTNHPSETSLDNYDFKYVFRTDDPSLSPGHLLIQVADLLEKTYMAEYQNGK